MLKTLLCIFFAFSILTGKAQGTKSSFPEKELSFDVIVGVSSQGETKTIKAVQKFFEENPAGISYLGYCNSQRCLILRAYLSHFYSADAVVNFLRNKFGSSILGYKEYEVKEFYRQCSFKSEREYKYFKTTYK
jgi:hypothetical protein